MPTHPLGRLGRPADPTLLERWRQRLQRFECSDLSVVAFCAQERISVPSFYGWRKRLRPTQPAQPTRPQRNTTELPRLVSVQVATPPIPAKPIELLLPGGVLLRLPAGCDLNFVRSLVQALEGRPC